MKKNLGRNVVNGLAAALLIAQLVPYPPAENPPVGDEVPAPAEVRSVLRTSCYDCHSNETVWPWYSGVIPAKWLVRNHVIEGRGHLNFSTWSEYPPERAARKLEEVVEMVEEGEMPVGSYVWLHGDAALSADEAALILDWARGLRASGNQGPGEGGGEPGREGQEG
ncbi:MAG: heme-binding domain-containing protein [Longimicrobiales bacterium]